MIPGQDALKYFGNHLLGYHRFDTAGDNLKALYDSLQDRGKMNKFKYHTKDTMILGDIWKVEDSMNYWNDYFKNRGIDWEDVKYPTMMSGHGLSSASWFSDVDALAKLYL